MSFFTGRSFSFLKDLAANNEREWFEENRSRYEADLKEPAQRFIMAVGEKLDRVSPELRADPRGNGGSLFRIHRDVRFSKDKSPYKTHAGIQFRHAAGKDAHAPGIYLHVEPGGCFLGLGVWRPPGPALRAIRARIDEEPAAWLAAVEDPDFTATFRLAGESLKTAPRGVDRDHPMIDHLRRKDYIAVTELKQKEVTSDDLPERLVELGLLGAPMMRFICAALDVRF